MFIKYFAVFHYVFSKKGRGVHDNRINVIDDKGVDSVFDDNGVDSVFDDNGVDNVFDDKSNHTISDDKGNSTISDDKGNSTISDDKRNITTVMITNDSNIKVINKMMILSLFALLV